MAHCIAWGTISGTASHPWALRCGTTDCMASLIHSFHRKYPSITGEIFVKINQLLIFIIITEPGIPWFQDIKKPRKTPSLWNCCFQGDYISLSKRHTLSATNCILPWSRASLWNNFPVKISQLMTWIGLSSWFCKDPQNDAVSLVRICLSLRQSCSLPWQQSSHAFGISPNEGNQKKK